MIQQPLTNEDEQVIEAYRFLSAIECSRKQVLRMAEYSYPEDTSQLLAKLDKKVARLRRQFANNAEALDILSPL